MSKSQFDTHLRYGQGILIQGYKTKGDDLGLLTAKGFADIKAKYQTYDDILYFKNYRNAIFQMLPAGNFQINDELHKALIQNQGNQQTPNIKILKARAKSQEVQFALNIENKQKNLVCFGNSVIFKHIDSQTYISGTIRPSNGSNGAFTVQVSNNLSQSLIFKLEPYRSFEFLGMPIPFDSPIKLKNQYNNGYLTFQKLGLGNIGKEKGMYIEKKPIESDESYKIPVKTQSDTSSIYETVTHFVDLSVQKEVPMPWKFVLHVNNVVNDTLIQHDIVYLSHTQNNGVLSMNKGEIILKELKQSESSELCFYECLWQIQKHDETDSSYILRHLMSGQTLGINYEDEIDQDGNKVFDEEGNPHLKPTYPTLIDISGGQQSTKYGVVQLKLAKKQGGDINSDSYVNVAWKDYILQIDEQAGEEQFGNDGEHEDELINKNKMAKILKQQIQFSVKKLKFRQNQSQKHCFVIQQIEDDLKKEVLFALSFHSVIINLRQDLKWGAIQAAKKISYLRMMQVTQKIRQIKDFLKNCSRQQADLDHIFPVQKRQMICKDLGISELLFELLFYMKMNIKEDIFSDKHNQREKFVQLYNTLYEVINELIRKNRLFKMHISKWIGFIFQDVIHNNQSSHLNLAKQLLTQNEFFVHNFVSEKLIAYFTDSMLQKMQDTPIFLEKKYLQILRLFCITGVVVNTANQIKIYNVFIKALQSQRGQPLNISFIKNKKDQILIKAAIDKTVQKEYTFAEFYQTCKSQNQSAWEYFVEYLNLIADMTQGRNKVTQGKLSKQFTLEILTQIFQNENLQDSEVPILRILHYLYAQSEQFYPIQKEKKIVNYNTLGVNEVSIISTPSVIKPWEPPFDKVLNTLLKKLKQCGPIDPHQYKKNKTVFEILNFVWQTLNLGFWADKQQVRNILNDVLYILKKNQAITNYQDAKIKSIQNGLMIKCKLQCLKIIGLVADYDLDLFVQEISIKFKQFPMPQKRRTLQGTHMGSLLSLKTNDQISVKFIQSLPSQEKIQPLIQTNICDQMIQLSNYDNPQLTSMAISIIERVLQTKKIAISNFSKQRFICEQDKVRLVEYIEKVRNYFYMLEDVNLQFIDFQSQRDNYFLVYEENNQNTLMAAMYNLSELMKNQNDITFFDKMKTLESSGIYQYLGGDKLINFTMERSSTNQTKQNIVYCSSIHTKVLKFIFNCKQLPQSELALKLLHLCYKFVVSMIQNYNEIKVLMVKQIPKMIHHINKNVGCVDFLKQMYDNNKNMLYNQTQVFSLIKFMCDAIENQSIQNYYKSKLLDFFRYLIYCNGRSLKFIQIQILKIMQDDTYKNIILKNQQLDKIEELVQQYEKTNGGKKPGQLIEMKPELTYIVTFFQILSSLIDDNNTVNMGKVIKRFPFDRLVCFLKASSKCWPLKRNIRTFLNRMYYFQPEVETNMKTILLDQFLNIQQDLNMYIQAKTDPKAIQYENSAFESPVRFSYMQSYAYLNLEQNLFTIFQLITRPECISQIVKFLNIVDNNLQHPYQHALNFIKISERLGWLRLFFTQNKNIYSNSMTKFILMKVKQILTQFNEEIFVVGEVIDSAENKQSAISRILTGQGVQSFFKQKSPKIRQSLPLTFQVPNHVSEIKQDKHGDRQKLLQKLRAILKRQKRDFKSQDQKVFYYMSQLINSLKLSKKVGEYFFDQFVQKVSTYSQRSDIYNYITSIINMNSNHSGALPCELKIFFLELVTFIIEQSNQAEKTQEAAEEEKKEEHGQQEAHQQKIVEPQQGEHEQQKLLKQEQAPVVEGEAEEQNGGNSRKSIDQWQAEDWQANADKIRQTQNKLKKCQLSKFIVDLLKEDIIEDIPFANSILLCSISYLLGGNNLTQKSIIQQLMKDQQNKVFKNIESLIEKLGKLILKNIDQGIPQIQDQQNAFCPTTIDNYDFFDTNTRYCLRKNVFEPNSTDEYLYHKLCIATYRRAFKFLQLLCQNNNIEGKHFIREQVGKQKQVNFINVTTKQLRNLFQVMCNQIKDVPIFLLDFILEVTQIPVKQNQEALMRSTFFQDLCQMQDFFTVQSNLQVRNLTDRSSLDDIFFKSVQIILSNFEGNSQKTFTSLDSKLQPKFLTNVLWAKLESIQITNRKKLVDHVNSFNRQEDQQGKKKTVYSEDVMSILDIMIIFMKMKDKLDTKSRIFTSYQKFKKQKRDKYEEDLKNILIQQYGDQQNQQYKEKVEAGIGQYKCMFEYLQKCLIHIEITDQNGLDQTLYFPNFPVFKSLSGNLRDFVMNQVERATHRDKIVSLLGYISGVKDKIQYSYNLQKKQKISESNMNQSYNGAATLSIIICFYMMVFYDVVIEYGEADFTSNIQYGLFRFALCLIQLGLSLMYAFYWYKLKIWYKPERVSRQAATQSTPSQQEGSVAAIQQAPVSDVIIEEAVQEVPQTILQKIKSKLLQPFAKIKQKLDPFLSLFAGGEQGEEQEQKIYKTGEFWRIAIFVGCSFLGTFFFPILFFIHLIDIFCKIEVLANIFEAVAVNIKSLLYVSFMGVVFVLIFCTVTFSNYMKNVYSEGQGVDQMCDSMLDCVMSLYVSGAIGQTMEVFQIGRFTYDMIYITFFGLLFGNIVQGIMLDAFAGLRQKNDELNDDKKNRCYICNIPRETLQKKGQTFKDHTQGKHFLWNYIFYIIALQRKNETDYTGLEYYISQKYNRPDEQMDVSWVPSKGESQFEIGEQAAQLTQKIKEHNAQFEQTVKGLEGRIQQFNKLAQQYAE